MLRDEQVRFDGFCLAKGTDDCPTLLGAPPVTTKYEAESLTKSTSSGSASLQTDANASGGQWVVYSAPGAGSWVRYTLPNLPKGIYSLGYTYKTSTTRGIHNSTLDGVAIGSTVDEYASGSALFPDVTLGTVRFDTVGDHIVRLTSTGKNPLSTGFQIAADRFLLVADPNPPAITVPSDMTVEATGPSGATASYSASATDKQEGTLPVTLSQASGSTFPLGSTTVTATASDLNGNTGTASFVVNVVDTTPPVLTLPGNLGAEATGPAGATVTFSGAAQDQVSGTVPVYFNPASGSIFPIGVTAVGASASDGSGNAATGTFSVTVKDTIAPVIQSLTATPNVITPRTTAWCPS